MERVGEQTWHQQRRHGLDALRVFAFGLLIVYHVGMAYVAGWDWHIKSVHQSELLRSAMLWSNQWRMSLLFVISGAAVAFMLQRQSIRCFLMQRHFKLILPLVFGIVFLIAPQAYVELKQKALIPELGYVEFWYRYLFAGWLLDQSQSLPSAYGRIQPTFLTWNHLWFLAYVFCYSVIVAGLSSAMPLARRCLSWLEAGFKLFPLFFLMVGPVLWLWLAGLLWWEAFPPSHALIDDWFNHARYMAAFVWGLLYVRTLTFRDILVNHRVGLLLFAVCSFCAVLFLFYGGVIPFFTGVLQGALEGFVWSLNSWLWVVVILAWAEAIFIRPNSVISRSNRGVYCFYLIHQTAIIVLLYVLQSYGLENNSLGPVLEPFTLLGGTLAICYCSYWVVRRVASLRPLMGVFH